MKGEVPVMFCLDLGAAYMDENLLSTYIFHIYIPYCFVVFIVNENFAPITL